MGGRAAGFGISRRNGVNYMRFKGEQDIVGKPVPEDVREVYLKAEWSADMLVRSYYSYDGVTYWQIGNPYQITGSDYRGGHIGLFCYNSLSENGYADFDYLRYEMS